MMVLFISILLATANLMNNLWDVDSDRKNTKIPWFTSGSMSIRQGSFYLIFLIVAGFAGLIFSGQWETIIPLIFLVFVVNVLYNVPPFSYKDKGWGSISISALYGITFWLIGTGYSSDIAALTLDEMLGYILAYTSVSLVAMMMDLKGDNQSAKKTFAVLFGKRKTSWISVSLVIAAIILAIIKRDFVLGVPSILTLPLFILNTRKQASRKILLLTARVPVVLLSVSVAIVYAPIYLAIIPVYFFLSKWYHSKRFDMNYPSFTKG